VSILIPLGLALLIFAKVPLLSSVISFTVNYLIYIIYTILRLIEQLPFSVLHDSVQSIQFIFIIGLLLSILFLLKIPRMRYIYSGLLFIFLLVVSGSFIKLNRLKEKEIIVYNYPENNLLQLIDGKENFVLSKKQITTNDYVKILLNETTEKLHLNNPVLITPSDTLINEHLFIENGVVIFGNKTILFEQPINLIPENYPVNFAINPEISNEEEWAKIKNSQVIINKSYFQKDSNIPDHLYTLTTEGVFRKKW